MKVTVSILDALQDPSLFGRLPAFRDLSTWTRWLVFLRALYGLPLDREGEALFCQHTGRSRYVVRPGGYAEAVAVVGRQAGKDRIGGVIQDYQAITTTREEDGTELFSLSIAQDTRSSLRTAFRYAIAPFQTVPLLAETVTGRTADAWTLDNGVVLTAYPCRPAAIRGLRARCVIASELAFYTSSEGNPNDVEMLRAARPCTATTDGRLVILSSPYGQTGALWELFRKHFGRDDASTLVWKASAPEMNPTLPADYLERMAEDDPEAYRSEVLGEFRAGIMTFAPPDVIEACVEAGVRERSTAPGVSYVSFTDTASGSGRDEFVLAIAHADGERVVLDLVRAWSPSFNPSGVIAEAAALLREWGLTTTTGDRYSPGFVLEGFRAHGVTYEFSTRDRSAVYLDLLPLLNSRRVVLLDDPEVLRQLRGLERRRGSSGRDRVDHRPNASDDRINAAAGACVLAVSPRGMTAEQLEQIMRINDGARRVGTGCRMDVVL
jgi:hypothetical protein